LASTISDRLQFALSRLDVDVARNRLCGAFVFRGMTGHCLHEPRKDAAWMCQNIRGGSTKYKTSNVPTGFHPDTQIRVIPHIVHYFEFIQYKRILLTTYI
jgi:hypothetical protein